MAITKFNSTQHRLRHPLPPRCHAPAAALAIFSKTRAPEQSHRNAAPAAHAPAAPAAATKKPATKKLATRSKRK